MTAEPSAQNPTTVRLYRGLRLPTEGVEEAMEILRGQGNDPARIHQRTFQRLIPDRLATLAKERIDLEDTRGAAMTPAPAMCACGDEAGASHYAWRGNGPEIPVMMEIEVPVERLVVDGNDFLFPVFSHGIPRKAAPVVERVFGRAAMAYAERAWSTPKGDVARLALCDLAILDPEVVVAHHANREGIAARYGTAFASAFSVRLPMLPGEVRRVWTPLKPLRPTPGAIDLEDLIERP